MTPEQATRTPRKALSRRKQATAIKNHHLARGLSPNAPHCRSVFTHADSLSFNRLVLTTAHFRFANREQVSFPISSQCNHPRKGLSPPSSLPIMVTVHPLPMVTVHPLPSTFAVPVRFPRLPGLTNGKCALSRATLRRRQGVLSRMTSSCLSGTDRLSADAVAVSRHGQFAPDGNPVRQPTQAASASPSGRRGSGGSTGSRPAESSSAAPTPPAAETPGRARRRRR